MPTSSVPGPLSCYASSDCAFLAHNDRLLEDLEQDVSKAAQLGQVCPKLEARRPAVPAWLLLF
jgi:hypothetical protein